MNSSWKGPRGLGCAVSVILLSRGLNEGFRTALAGNAALADWVKIHSHSFEACFHVLQGCMWLSVAYCFGGFRPVRLFLREAGLVRALTFSGWLCAWGA